MKKLLIAVLLLLNTSVGQAADHYVDSNEQGHWYLQTETVQARNYKVNSWINYWTKTVTDDGYVRIETRLLISKSGTPMYCFSYFQFYNREGVLLNQYDGSTQYEELYPNTLGYKIANEVARILLEKKSE